MAYIITRLCRDCVDTACVAVCPVDCIYRYTGSDSATFPNQLYIHPDECIDCTACVPVCPVEAIFAEGDVPEKWKSFIDENKQKASQFPNITVKKEALGKDKPECKPGAK